MKITPTQTPFLEKDPDKLLACINIRRYINKVSLQAQDHKTLKGEENYISERLKMWVCLIHLIQPAYRSPNSIFFSQQINRFSFSAGL